MTVQHEIKSQLAKLLATEDILVEHKKVETAEFNVQTRVLTLPMWEKASSRIIDMLVGHEVGHALYTPDTEWWKEVQIPQQFVNVVEDARIEKLIKRRYEGLNKTFYNAYHELSDKDFFDIQNKDMSDFNLADRVNLYFKIGHFVDIDFNTEENFLVSKIELAETFEEVLVLAKELYTLCKQQLEQENKERQEVENDTGIDLGDETFDGTPQGKSEEAEEEVDLDYQKSESQPPTIEEIEDMMDELSNRSQPQNTEPEVETMDALDEALKDLINRGGRENHYIELPKVDIDQVVISNERVHKEFKEHWTNLNIRIQSQFKENPNYFISLCNPERIPESYDPFEELDKNFYAFKKSAQKEVSYLVKEFECKKSAGAYARATTSRTGVLDTTKLHTYKYNEDLFKKVSVIPEGKNHGLVFILDWSGSMSHVMMDTIKQLYNLMWFCKKVQIPFDVYAFTSSYPKADRDERGYASPLYDAKDNMMVVENQFSLMNLFTSQTRVKELNEQMMNIFRIVNGYRDYGTRELTPFGLELSGTPLNETIVALHDLIPQFQAKTKVEKVNCVILTDGEGYQLSYHRTVNRSLMGESYFGRGNWGDECILRNRKTGKTYNCGYQYHDFTKMLLRNISDELRNVNFVGIRIMDGRDAKHFVQMNSEDFNSPEVEKTMQQWRKTKTLILEDVGYKVYLGLSSSAVGNDAEFEVKEDASKADIKRAFTKSLKNKKMNKKILSKFIEMVA